MKSAELAHGLVAAAGTGGRMGFPKALLAVKGGPPLALSWARAMRAAGLPRVTVTLPDSADLPAAVASQLSALRDLLHAEGALTCPNPWPTRGLLGSVQSALRGSPTGAALLLVPVDVPCVPGAVQALLRIHVAHPLAVVRTHVRGAPAHPVLLPAAACNRALSLGDDATLRDAFAGLPEAAWHTEEDALALNLNTPADLHGCAPPHGPWSP